MSDPMYGNQYPGMPQNPLLSKLRPPAIAMMVAAGLNILSALLMLVGQIAQLLGMSAKPDYANSAEAFGGMVGSLIAIVSIIACLVLSPMVIQGAIQMFRGGDLSTAQRAGIIMVIPFTSCCCIVGIPVGIWVLVVLNQPDVKAYAGTSG